MTSSLQPTERDCYVQLCCNHGGSPVANELGHKTGWSWDITAMSTSWELVVRLFPSRDREDLTSAVPTDSPVLVMLNYIAVQGSRDQGHPGPR